MSPAQEKNPTLRYIILGRAPGQTKAKAMDLGEGVQVDRLIYATLLTEAEASYALEALHRFIVDFPNLVFPIPKPVCAGLSWLSGRKEAELCPG